MPPPPPRGGHVAAADMNEDSQLTQLKVFDGGLETSSVSDRMVKDRKFSRSLQDSSVPAGFFEEMDQPKPKRAKQAPESDFDAFMQEMSAMGAVRHNNDDTVVEVQKDNAAENSVEDVQSAEGEDETEEQFEQFVRKERMREIKEAVANRNTSATLNDGNAIFAEVSGMESANVPDRRIPISLPMQQSIADSYKEVMQADDETGESTDEDDNDLSWRQKRL
jgi:predicted lipid-binding transport protein (Tim44 family)